MKRELAFVLEARSELPLFPGRTRASAGRTRRGDLNGGSGDRSGKRFKAAGLNASGTNGGIHGSQERLEVNGSSDKSQAKNVKGSQCDVVAVYRRTRARNASSGNGQKVDESKGLETVVDRTEFKLLTECGDENNGVLADSASRKEELGDCCEKPTINEDGSEFVPMAIDESSEVWKTENSGVRNDVTSYGGDKVKGDGLVVAPRRFTRLAWDSDSDVELVECPVSVAAGSEVSGGGENETLLNVEVNVVNALGTPTKTLELKMSKKIALGRIPRTVKELFATGLLDGYAVFYNGGNKGSELQGMIKDVGILCFCSLCKGSRVINPSKFEIHACKSYRRAAQYICLENGRSLLEVLKTCKDSPLDILEETIQSVIGPPLPAKESVICQSCKGSFLGTFSSKKVEQLCPSCVGLNNSEATPTHAIDTNSRLSKQVSNQKTCRSASVRILSQNKSQPNITERSTKAVTAPWLSKNSPCLSPQENSKWKITKKDLRLHKMVFEDGGLPDGTEVAYYSRGQRLLEGYKRGLGIICRCCNSEVSPSQFEAHAGWASHKKPYGYIYTSNGVSLHEFAISLLKGGKYSVKENDDLCIICADGGNLLLCDGCPRAFHIECASLSSIPCGKWYCKYCQNLLQKEKFVQHNANAVAAGRVSGADPIEQITKRCIRIVKYPEDAEVIACILCRAYDFSKSGFGPRTVIVCDQCEKEYHVGCLKKHKMADLKELPEGKWFCCIDCQRIYSALQNLLIRGEEEIQDSLLDVLKQKHKEKVSDTVTDLDVRWRLLSGKIASPDTRSLLSKAVAIFHECFDPIVDSATGRDFIPSMVYGRNIRGQDFGGMYCAILTVNSSIVSAGIFRVLGQGIAELPLVATSKGNQGKGYFQILFSRIEKLLTFLNVKTLVLPAAEEAESMWTDKFGLKKTTPEQLSNYRKICWQMVTFQGTSTLQKMVPPRQLIQQDIVDASIHGV